MASQWLKKVSMFVFLLIFSVSVSVAYAPADAEKDLGGLATKLGDLSQNLGSLKGALGELSTAADAILNPPIVVDKDKPAVKIQALGRGYLERSRAKKEAEKVRLAKEKEEQETARLQAEEAEKEAARLKAEEVEKAKREAEEAVKEAARLNAEEVEKEKVRLQAEAAKKVPELIVSRPEGTRSHPIGSGISSVIAVLNAENARKQEEAEAEQKLKEKAEQEKRDAELPKGNEESDNTPKSMKKKPSLAKSRKKNQLSKENKSDEEASRLAKEQEVEAARLKAEEVEAAARLKAEKEAEEVAKFQTIKNKITNSETLSKEEADVFASYALDQLKTDSISDEDKAVIKAFLLKAINASGAKKTTPKLEDVKVAVQLLSDLAADEVIKAPFVIANIEGIIAILSADVVQEKGLIGILQTLVNVEKNIQAREQIEQVITMLNSNNYGNDAPGKDFKGLMTWSDIKGVEIAANEPYKFKYWATGNKPQDAKLVNKGGGMTEKGADKKLKEIVLAFNQLRNLWNNVSWKNATASGWLGAVSYVARETDATRIAAVLDKAQEVNTLVKKDSRINGNLDEFIKHIDLLPKA